MDVDIAPERHADHASIRDVVDRAFHSQPGVGLLVDLIRASPQYLPDLALVARADHRVVGFVMISGACVVEDGGRAHDVLTLSPLAVAPEQERRGIGSELVHGVLAAAGSAAEGIVTLEGDPAYYSRFGFRPAADFGIAIELPDRAPAEAAQVYPLPTYDPAVRGTLRYPPAFAAVE